jgi:glucose-6-phosphate isomerase
LNPLTKSPAWRALAAHREQIAGSRISDLFAADPERASRMSLEFGELFLDYSRHLASPDSMRLLFALAEQSCVPDWIRRMFAGEPINDTENQPALHVALRSDRAHFPDSGDVLPKVREVLARMRVIVGQTRSGQLRGSTGRPALSFVNLGIGGSDLGPRMLTRALGGSRPNRETGLQVRFVANADPSDLAFQLHDLDPQTTFFIVASKSFTTEETLANANRAREWLAQGLPPGADPMAHFFAVTAYVDRARAFGIGIERILPIWNWVGGRFSVWSAVGLPVALALGMEQFDALLEGARDMDAHFHTAPLERNMPVIMALLSVWYTNFWDAQTHAVIPYSEDLRDLPAYLQQLEMESNGKRVDREGREVDYATAPVVWGASGTSSQHSFHQLLHQGTHLVPVDFILAAGGGEGRDALQANAIAQAIALMNGQDTQGPPHCAHPGNRPSSMLLLERLAPEALGQLLALYEHKVFVEGVIWNINSFDQWGVELGKTLARGLLPAFRGEASSKADPSARALIERIRRLRND